MMKNIIKCGPKQVYWTESMNMIIFEKSIVENFSNIKIEEMYPEVFNSVTDQQMHSKRQPLIKKMDLILAKNNPLI